MLCMSFIVMEQAWHHDTQAPHLKGCFAHSQALLPKCNLPKTSLEVWMNAVTVQLGFIPPAVAWKQCIRQRGNSTINWAALPTMGLTCALLFLTLAWNDITSRRHLFLQARFRALNFFAQIPAWFLLLMGPAEHVTDRNAKQNKSLSRLPLHRTSLWGRCVAVHVKDKGNARKITDFLLEIKLP